MSEFIPKQYKKEAITARIGYDKLEKIYRLSGKYDVSRNEVISQHIDNAMDHIGQFPQEKNS